MLQLLSMAVDSVRSGRFQKQIYGEKMPSSNLPLHSHPLANFFKRVISGSGTSTATCLTGGVVGGSGGAGREEQLRGIQHFCSYNSSLIW